MVIHRAEHAVAASLLTGVRCLLEGLSLGGPLDCHLQKMPSISSSPESSEPRAPGDVTRITTQRFHLLLFSPAAPTLVVVGRQPPML